MYHLHEPVYLKVLRRFWTLKINAKLPSTCMNTLYKLSNWPQAVVNVKMKYFMWSTWAFPITSFRGENRGNRSDYSVKILAKAVFKKNAWLLSLVTCLLSGENEIESQQIQLTFQMQASSDPVSLQSDASIYKLWFSDVISQKTNAFLSMHRSILCQWSIL